MTTNRLFIHILLIIISAHSATSQPCYAPNSRAVACYPKDTSLSFERQVLSTSTCGELAPTQYATRISAGEVECCRTCDFRFANTSHPTSHLTDLHVPTSVTSWLSETGIHSPDKVNLTLSLPCRVELDTLTLQFVSFRPHSLFIEKSLDGGVSFSPMRYFSDDCVGKYGMDPRIEVLNDNDVICETLTLPSPGVVLYIPDQTRPLGITTAPEESEILTDFITLTDLRIVLDGHRIYPGQLANTTEGDLVYYYEISDMSVAGRCACNGHASECNQIPLTCVCQHNTQGKNCEECLSFYQAVTWRRSTPANPSACEQCECNLHSISCYFNSTVYSQSNNTSGGVCIDCMHNTTGINCESCLDTFYRDSTKSLNDSEVCRACACDMPGVANGGECNTSTGQCECKQNVMGKTCDQCRPRYYNLSSGNALGCSECNCNLLGSMHANCNSTTGQCECRDNTQSLKCDQCKRGFFNVMSGTMDGCLECECDLGGSLSPTCEGRTGQCECREGVSGRRCDDRSEGFFVPLIDYVTLEAETGNGTFTILSRSTGVNREFTGTGFAELSPDETVTFLNPVSVSRSGVYQFVIRYTLRSISAISLTIRFDLNASNSRTDSACTQQILTPTLIPIMNVIPGTAVQTSIDVCISSNIEYTITLSHASSHSVILIDSLVVIPLSVLPTLAVFAANSSLLSEYETRCVEPRKQVSTWSSINTSFCNPVTLSASAELYNGLLPCRCSIGGSVGDNCTFSGQCMCLSGIGGDRVCSQCSPGYFGLITGVGCSACECGMSGSISGVCHFASGQCDCLSLVQGQKCGGCVTGAFNLTSGFGCEQCGCNVLGAANFQCSGEGVCACKSGVEGEKCDMCIDGYFALGLDGCTRCDCDGRGVVEGVVCDSVTGMCQCKLNVEEGGDCGACRNGYFNLEAGNPTGCRACYCNLRDDGVCSSAPGYVEGEVLSVFNTNSSNPNNGWATIDSNEDEFFGSVPSTINSRPSVTLFDRELFFRAPREFLNFKLSSYAQDFSLLLTISPLPDSNSFTCPPYTLLLRSPELELGICTQLNITDGSGLVWLRILLHEVEGWVRTDSGGNVTELEFLSVLSNLSALLVRGNFFSGSNTYFHQVSLPTAVRSMSGSPVGWVESCACHANYTGLSCSRCAPGYYRQSDGSCFQCECFGNASELSCDASTGECITCPPFTTGDSCETCIPGYYGSPSEGVDCLPCTCPGPVSSFSPLCELIPILLVSTRGLDLECTNCSDGHTGLRCQFCADNYYGDPTAGVGCTLCDCSENIILGESGNCDNRTGECLRCVGNTTGDMCEVCLLGFYGDAITAKNCTACMCNVTGAENAVCDRTTSGQCECKANVGGRRCDVCIPGYFSFSNGTGCSECNCDTVGSTGVSCDVASGQCQCKSGVTGLKCENCIADYYGFSQQGCLPCDCFEAGSITTQCNSQGICACMDGVYGTKCNNCTENFYDVTQGCLPCPECYQELQENINVLRGNISDLNGTIENIASKHNPVPFTERLRLATLDVENIVSEANRLKQMERINLLLTSQLEYTAVFLRNFMIQTNTGIEIIDNQASFIGLQAISAAVLVNETIQNMLFINDYLQNDPREYLNLTAALVDVLNELVDIADQMESISRLHKQQADQINTFITAAGILSSNASITVMESYQELLTSLNPSLTLLISSIATSSNSVNAESKAELDVALQQLSDSTNLFILAQAPNANDGYNLSDFQNIIRGFGIQSNNITELSNMLSDSINSLILRIEDLFKNLAEYAGETLTLVENDSIFRSSALAVFNTSRTARNRGMELVAILNATLSIVMDFNASTNIAQRQAMESLEKVGLIHELSTQAQRNVSQVINQLLTTSVQSLNAYNLSVRAGEIATEAYLNINIFNLALSNMSDEISRLNSSFNSNLSRIQEISLGVMEQDRNISELRANATAEANFCIQQARDILNLNDSTTVEINRIISELNTSLSTLERPEVNLGQLNSTLQTLRQSVAQAQLEQSISLLRNRLESQKESRTNAASRVSQLKQDLTKLQDIERTLPKSCNFGS